MYDEQEFHEAAPRKLRSGVWGALVLAPKSEVQKGDQIRIMTKAGKTWMAQVTKIAWGNDEVTLVETRNLDADEAYARRGEVRKTREL